MDDKRCPTELRPINNNYQCPTAFPFKYTTPSGEECCRKMAGRRRKGKVKKPDYQYDLASYKKIAKKIQEGIKPNAWAAKNVFCPDFLVSVVTDKERNEVPIYELLIDSLNIFPESLPIITKIIDNNGQKETPQHDEDGDQGDDDDLSYIEILLSKLKTEINASSYEELMDEVPELKKYMLTPEDIHEYKNGTLPMWIFPENGYGFIAVLPEQLRTNAGKDRSRIFPEDNETIDGESLNDGGWRSFIVRKGMAKSLRSLIKKHGGQIGGGNPEDLTYLCNLINTALPSEAWLRKQKKYLQSLPEEDQMFVKLYTKKGDVFINSYIRNGYKVDASDIKDLQEVIPNDMMTTVEEGNKFAKTFYDSLQKTILNAPPLDKTIVVWRGMKSTMFSSPDTPSHFHELKDHIYLNKRIMSTTLKPGIAHNFAFLTKGFGTDINSFRQDNRYGYVSRITIPKGYSVLYVSYSEFMGEREILLPDNSVYYVTESFRKIPHIIDSKFVRSSFAQTIGSPMIATNEIVLIKE